MALGTVVGVAAGMLTLGDHPPDNTGSAAVAPSGQAYRTQVVGVCERVNAAERLRLRDLKRLRHAVNAAYTTRAQRDAILVATRGVVSRGGRNLAQLQTLEPPQASRALHAATVQLWNRSLDRMRDFGVRLDSSSNRSELRSAIAPLTTARPAMERDSVTLAADLQRLGGSGCQIHSFSEQPVPLPPLRKHKNKPDASGPDVAPRSTATPPRPGSGPDVGTATPPPADSGPDVSPALPAPTPRAPDVAPGGGGGGGGGGAGGGGEG